MHEIRYLGSGGVTREVHPTVLLDVGYGVVEQFLSDYLAENGRRIPILDQIFINGGVELLVIPDFRRTSGPMYTDNILAPHDITGWVSSVPPIRTGYFSMGDLMEALQSCGVVSSLTFLLTSPGVRRTCALLHATSVITTIEVGVVHA